MFLQHESPPSELVGGVMLGAYPHKWVVVSDHHETMAMEVVSVHLHPLEHHQASTLSSFQGSTPIGHDTLMPIVIQLGEY